MEQQIEHIGDGENADFVEIAGGENADFMEIAGGDQVNMARLTEIRSWFHNILQMNWTAMATLKKMTRRERAKLPPTRTTDAQGRDPPLGDGAGRFVQPVDQAEVVGIQIQGRASTGSGTHGARGAVADCGASKPSRR